MSDILERLRLRQSRIVDGTMHTCGDTCTHPDCLAVASLREIERLRFIIANYESRTASPALSVLALTEEINRLRAEVERLRGLLREARRWLDEYRDVLVDEPAGTDRWAVKHAIGAWLDDIRDAERKAWEGTGP